MTVDMRILIAEDEVACERPEVPSGEEQVFRWYCQ